MALDLRMDEAKLTTPGVTPGPPLGTNDEPGSSLDSYMRTAFRIIRRRYKLAIATFLFFTVPVAWYLNQRPPRFLATARILVEQSPEVAALSSSTASTLPSQFGTEALVLRSRPIVTKAIERIRLWEKPGFGPPPAGSDERAAAEGAVDAFLARLAIVPQPGTLILNVSFESDDPAVAMDAVNALIQVHADEQAKAQFAESADTVEWFGARVEEQRQKLEASENALYRYMLSQDAVSVQDRQNIVVQRLADLNGALTRAKTDLIAKRGVFEQVTAARNSPAALDSVPVVLSNPTLQQLRATVNGLRQKELVMSQELGDRHPELISLRSELSLNETRLEAELGKVIESVENELRTAEALEAQLTAALDLQKQEVLALNRQSIEYGALEREAVANRETYARLMSEAQTRDITGTTTRTQIRVIEAAALPRIPLGPPRSTELAIVVLAGLLLGALAPLVREALDHRMKTPEDIARGLGLNCLAIIPENRSTSPVLFTERRNLLNEGFRTLRASLGIGAIKSGTKCLLVTSPRPGEGKTFVATNLALALARMNQHVLLIDGDLRRPSIHALLGLPPSPGLVDLLKGQARVDEVVHETATPNLSVLPCGTEADDCVELLATPSLGDVLRMLGHAYDWIVVDTPPVGPVADACIIGRFIKQAVMVVVADRTPSDEARLSMDRLEAADVQVIGAVLNRADLTRSGYYYSPYYSQEYKDYYSAAGAS